MRVPQAKFNTLLHFNKLAVSCGFHSNRHVKDSDSDGSRGRAGGSLKLV